MSSTADRKLREYAPHSKSRGSLSDYKTVIREWPQLTSESAAKTEAKDINNQKDNL